MRRAAYLLSMTFILSFILFATNANAQKKAPEEKLGWQLGVQAWTFNNVTFSEALEKINSIGLKYVEAFPGQTIGGGIEGKMDFDMPEATRKQVKKLLKKHKIKMVSYGVVKPKTHEEWEQLFQFAKYFNLENVVSEPDEQDIPFLSQLCDKYKINLAIHNHPKPSHYWNPDILLSAIDGASSRIGSCADIGHWTRSGLDVMESLKKVEGHIKEFHFKDLNEKGPKAHDVHWGAGVNNVKEIIKEMKAMNFRGPVMVEYEYNWGKNVPDVKASIEYFREQVRALQQ